jgi:lipopolysaccharide export system ATP-binding protein
VGLLGPNGAGKTTAFYMIVGLVPADGGRIRIDAADITAHSIDQRARLGIGYLPQEPSVFRKLSVADNILGVLELRADLDDAQRDGRLAELLEQLRIGHVRDSLGMSLSGGERRRVEIARALAANPRFILLDEPFAGVDPLSVLDIQQIIQARRTWHRRADHRPQCARDAGCLRARLHCRPRHRHCGRKRRGSPCQPTSP